MSQLDWMKPSSIALGDAVKLRMTWQVEFGARVYVFCAVRGQSVEVAVKIYEVI